MIRSFTITNDKGDSVKLDPWHPEHTGLAVASVAGLNPTNANILTNEYAVSDGAMFNFAHRNQRNIVFTLIFTETDLKESIEDVRQKVYRYFPTKKSVEIVIETDNHSLKTTGYVESNEVSIFSSKESTQISIVCPDAYLYSTSDTIAAYSGVIKAFTFPFAIDENGIPLGYYSNSRYVTLQNNGVETGLTIEIEGIGDSSEKTTKTLTIYNADTGAYMRLKHTILSGDIITITTHQGRKTCTLVREGITTNIIGSLILSDWLTAKEGENTFYISASSGVKNVKVTFALTEAYTGV